jgi:multidrug efflux system membrane fusion protein
MSLYSGRPRETRWFKTFAAALVCAAVLGFFGCKNERARGRRPPIPVTAAAAVKKDIPVEIRAIGQVEPLATVKIVPQVSGQLDKVHFQEGKLVQAGQVLFTIDPRPYQADLDQAKAKLTSHLAELADAQRQVARYRRLVKRDFVSQEQFDTMVLKVATLKASVLADRAAIVASRLKLGYCTIRSPITGLAGKLLVTAGNQVWPTPGQNLVVINQMQPVYVSFAIPGRLLGEVRRYSTQKPLLVRAVQAGDTRPPATGTLTFIDNEIDKTTGTVILRATFANKDLRFWPGRFVTASLILKMEPGVVVVPSQAVREGPGRRMLAFVIGPNLVVSVRSVTVERVVGGLAVISRGIKAGERVATSGQLGLHAGARVLIRTLPPLKQSTATQIKAAAQADQREKAGAPKGRP